MEQTHVEMHRNADVLSCEAVHVDQARALGAVMLGSSASGPVALKAGWALLTLLHTVLQEDQENSNPEKRKQCPPSSPRPGGPHGPAPQPRPKT
ncbi:hypothetical protein GH733_001760 [Mirounga leonina]|nr:hypothetical protein GH733_001760 [Mirounga leonina]